MSSDGEIARITQLGGGAAASDGHTPEQRYKVLHQSASKLKNGACLVHCNPIYQEECSCSYRWQAAYRALNEDAEIYGMKTGEKDELQKVEYSAKYARKLEKMRVITFSTTGQTTEPETFLSKTGKKMLVAYAKPFRTPKKPWKNAAHHLIPVGVLLDKIEQLTTGDPGVTMRILQGLLVNHYNINFWVNMMILPQTSVKSFELGLPTHVGGHSNYSHDVRKQVDEALRAYETAIVMGGECEDPPEGPDIVKKLQELSQRLHNRIIAAKEEFKEVHENIVGNPGSVKKMGVNAEDYRDWLFRNKPFSQQSTNPS